MWRVNPFLDCQWAGGAFCVVKLSGPSVPWHLAGGRAKSMTAKT